MTVIDGHAGGPVAGAAGGPLRMIWVELGQECQLAFYRMSRFRNSREIPRRQRLHASTVIAGGITGRTMSSGPSGTATACPVQPQIDSMTRSGSE